MKSQEHCSNCRLELTDEQADKYYNHFKRPYCDKCYKQAVRDSEYVAVDDRIIALTFRVAALEDCRDKLVEIAKNHQSTINNLIESIGSLEQMLKLVKIHGTTLSL